ncbi:MAG: hypothetical protein KAJ19_27510, partial [Gammaproteobacteria bacterium]|nr:hypothetical protein [Gammaproteobacteria bacterium]
MADPDFTLTVTGARNLGGGARIVYGTFTSDGGTYVAGGHEPTGGFDGIDQIANEQPTFVLFASTNGWNYEYNNSTEKVLIR